MALVTVQRSPTPSTSSSPCVSESGSGEDDRRSQPRSISESFLTVKGAALFLPRGNGSSASSTSRFSQLRSKHAGDIQQHLQTMFTLLRPEDNIKLAVRLESIHAQITRYMVVVSTNGRQDTEESVVLGMDFSPRDGSCSIGLVLPLWSDTLIHLDGDGGFSVSTDTRVHIFKPVSVQAMWSALQSLHKACEVARCYNYFPGSLFLTWVSYYQSRVTSDQVRINEWNAMQDVQSHRADSPLLFSDAPTERELTERQIKTRLREIMMQKDLENVTSKEIRTELEMNMTCNLREFKEFIDNEMIVILGQMDSPTEIFEHVFLGSEWNASNLEELQSSGVQYILNVTREIDNFFPGVFEYHNIRVYDEEATDLLAYWNDTYKFISRAKKAGSKCLVHCKMGISRSAATVIAYAMKEYGWDLNKAFDYVKERRTVTKPNPSFMRQLEEYQGILVASKQRHNKLWRSHSDSDLSDHHEPLAKPCTQQLSLGHSDPREQAGSKPGPSVKELLESLGTPANAGKPAQENQPAPAAKPKQLGPSPPEDVAATPGGPEPPSLRSPPEAAEDQKSSSPSNGPCEAEEAVPKAIVAVPKPPKPDATTVAQSNLVVRPPSPLPPPPPPCCQHAPLPPAPPQPQPEMLSVSVPVIKPLVISVPQAQPAPSPQQAVVQCLPAPVPVGVPGCEQRADGSPLNGLEAPPPTGGDTVSDPGAVPPEGEQLLSPTADHINFFSAREKFKGMSQDGRGCQQKACGKEQPAAVQEVVVIEGAEGEKRKEPTAPEQMPGLKSAVSTETQPLCSSSQPVPQGVHQQEALEGQDVYSPKKVGSAKEEAKAAEEEVAAAAEEEEEEEEAAGFCSNWTRGSVKRATRQLEQKLKQEAPPLTSSPPSLSGGCSLRRPHSNHPAAAAAAAPGPQEAPVCLHVSVVGGVREQKDGGDVGVVQPEGGGAVLMNAQEDRSKSTRHRLQPADHRPLSTSTHHCSAHSPFASVNFLCLEGVTEHESSADWDCFPEGPHGDVVMRETWETLCELGAFLQQVRVGGAFQARRADRGFGPGAGMAPKLGGGGLQKRVSEVEARIRQAGLTPPSLMKRSASLAKLGCLELLANDFSEWELSHPCVSPSSAEAAAHPLSDESKKKRVQNCPPSESQLPNAAGGGAESVSEAELTSQAPQSPVSGESLQGAQPLDCQQNSAHVPAATLKIARQQYGRTHPLRRLKKRTASTFYHTM